MTSGVVPGREMAEERGWRMEDGLTVVSEDGYGGAEQRSMLAAAAVEMWRGK